ncbi:DUF2946 family protein [Pseudomonas sp.]|uniref:DUF2946 family protein n=1 Tax=Pseudomonas sp. TaxID=306 RepID=UPI003C73695B
MKPSHRHRALTAWTLYCSLLLGLFACGIHHGQMSGLSLSGLGSGFCSLGSDNGPGVDLGSSEQTQQTASSLSCPLCSSFAGAVAINTSTWALDYAPGSAVAPIVVRSWAQPPPRYLWPALNPRASPANFLAVNPSV